MTPYTAKNFAIGGPTAREGQLDRFFLQKWHFIYKLSVKKQRTGQKTGKNPPKKVVFSSLFDQLAEFEQKRACPFLFEQKRTGPFLFEQKRTGPFLFEQKRTGPFLFEQKRTGSFSVQTQPADRRGWKNHLFWRVFARFLSCSLLFHRWYVHDTDI